MYDKIRLLLDEDIPEEILDIYINRAISSIYNYMNNPRFTDEYIKERFEDVIIAIVEESYNSKDNKNIKQVRQGSRYITYTDENGYVISSSILSMLPTPYVRVY